MVYSMLNCFKTTFNCYVQQIATIKQKKTLKKNMLINKRCHE